MAGFTRVFWVVIFGGALASPAYAQSSSDSAAAQGLFDDAKALMAAGKPREACPKLEESQRLDPGSGTLVNLALCYEKSGRLASAWSRYLDAAAAAKASGNTTRETGARNRAAALAPHVSKLQINVSPEARSAGLEVTRDGEPVGAPQWGAWIPADEGEHAIVAKAPGFKEWHGNAFVKGDASRAVIEVPPLEAKPQVPAPISSEPVPPPGVAAARPAPAERASSSLGGQRVAALVAGGVGVIGLGVGMAFGIKSKSDHDEADKTCTGATCSSAAGATAGNSAHSAGNLSTVASIVGVAALAGGAVLWFTATPSDAAPRESGLRFGIGPGLIQARGTFEQDQARERAVVGVTRGPGVQRYFEQREQLSLRAEDRLCPK